MSKWVMWKNKATTNQAEKNNTKNDSVTLLSYAFMVFRRNVVSTRLIVLTTQRVV